MNGDTSGSDERITRQEALDYVDDGGIPVDQKPSSRRGFLGGAFGTVGAGLASALGLAGTSSATQEREQAVEAARRYSSKGKVHRAITTQTRELRTALSERGFLDSSAADELLEPELLSLGQYLDADEGMVAAGTIHEGTPTARIEITRQFPSYELKVTVYPESGETAATVRSDSEEYPDHQIIRGESATSDDVSTQQDCYCDPYTTCDTWYDSGGQRWCVCVYHCDPGGDCDPICDSCDYSCSSCSNLC